MTKSVISTNIKIISSFSFDKQINSFLIVIDFIQFLDPTIIKINLCVFSDTISSISDSLLTRQILEFILINYNFNKIIVILTRFIIQKIIK